ncbi:helix-turn-helix domain-containing protein [Brachybacterium sp. AOP29-B2-41]|uniref:helix-turn-helix domain-containing protein n=1 Tax=Brachybacterium sp. AOP29-B2-41 TaxID=3457704 RepID=UPI00403318F9
METIEVLSRKFITLDDLQEVMSISRSQAYALVRSGELRALRVGGRGQWRIEITELDAYIERCYQAADATDAIARLQD